MPRIQLPQALRADPFDRRDGPAQHVVTPPELAAPLHHHDVLGPLHHGVVYPSWTGPWQFLDRGAWKDGYVRVPYGLTAGPALAFRSLG